MFNASTAGIFKSITCDARNKLRFRLVPSANMTTTSGWSSLFGSHKTSNGILSSGEVGYKLYVPGKSTISKLLATPVVELKIVTEPVFFSTVTPGKLAIF